MEKVFQYIHENEQRFMDDLFAFLRVFIVDIDVEMNEEAEVVFKSRARGDIVNRQIIVA